MADIMVDDNIATQISQTDNSVAPKKRRATPYFPKSVQQQIIDEYNKGAKAGELVMLMEEEEDEEDIIVSGSNMSGSDISSNISNRELEENWSQSFLKKLHSIAIVETKLHETEDKDFSEMTEAEVMHKIQEQNLTDNAHS